MSQIPRGGGGKPIIKSTTTTTTKIPGGGSRTTTTTKIRELAPCVSADPSVQSMSQSGIAACQKCPSGQQGQRSMAGRSGVSGLGQPGASMRQQPSTSGMRQPGASMRQQPSASGMRQPGASMSQQPSASGMRQPGAGTSQQPSASETRQPGASGLRPSTTCRAKQTSGIKPPGMAPPESARPAPYRAPPSRPAPMPGQYNVPAPYGPMSRQGREMAFSSPEGLRGQMEARIPKDLRYESIKVCPGAGARDRSALQGTQMADMFSGSYNVYGGPTTSEEMVDRSILDERINQSTAQELFDMSSPEVTKVEQRVAQELMEKSMANLEETVFARGKGIHCVKKAPMIQTPAGMEPVLQQTYTEKRVERDEHAETVVKNLAVTELDETSGMGSRVTLSEQQLDPDYGLSSEGTDIITVKETVSVTPSYTSTAKDVIHEVVTPRIDIDPTELAKMVEDENQDVENTLKMAPPDLPLKEDRYAVKKRLQKLRLNTESMSLLEESVVNPVPTADEAMAETPPEALVNIMHTVENGVTPECAPDQVFHTLFEEKSTEQSVVLSSIGPGPLQDVVVPQTLTKDIHKESMTHDLTDLTNIYKNVTDAKDWPPVDIFDSVMDDEKKNPKKEMKTRKFKPLEDEEMPWAEEDLEPLVNIVGAEPAVVLDPANVPDLETSGNLETELSHGIEYFVDADPVQYMSRVQLRGSQPPPWFPGYIFCLPEFPDVVKLARNPDEVFISAWRSCQPKIIPETSMSILQ